MERKTIFANLEEVQRNNSDFKKEWSDADNTKVNKALRRLFVGHPLIDHNGNRCFINSFTALENFFGLPYTSSSSFAMISNTNTRYCIDKNEAWNIEYFALDTNNNVILSVWDRDENEKFYIL
jgi:hypothetical protein